MRWIAIAVATVALAACTDPIPESYVLAFTEQRADTQLEINGAMVDGGGAVPRMLTIRYDFGSTSTAKDASYLLQTFASASKLGELTVAPRVCDGVETAAVLIGADGSIGTTTDDCAPAAP